LAHAALAVAAPRREARRRPRRDARALPADPRRGADGDPSPPRRRARGRGLSRPRGDDLRPPHHERRARGLSDDPCVRRAFETGTTHVARLWRKEIHEMAPRQLRAVTAPQKLELEWEMSPRWQGISRDYSAEDVLRLRGSIEIRHTLAELGAERLWQLLQEE